MFELMGAFLWLLITGVASIAGYITVKRFVRNRLRFVDAIQKRHVPALAGVAAAPWWPRCRSSVSARRCCSGSGSGPVWPPGGVS